MSAWTTEKPTVPGWYWYKDAKNGQRIVELFPSLEGLHTEGWLVNRGTYFNGEWSGPLTPPDEVQT